ncbi:MAG: penicillin-binding protein 2 [Nitrincola lacisaponensis]|uniref:Peptidoglycan D,D-transpeptidase MrdA n=1 Tax=Nitrincola lacisaponensis TaxID=267850 RepID=A0A063Y3V1_9GAMM|nr:penicillin-binding protein 2 [Nitrincola lacisaponensis]KDE40369.1 Penicillin-binding protein 2 (PBP-2) [Nitrincola lacisaponensis]
MQQETLKDYSQDARIFKFRAALALVVVTLAFSVLLGRVYFLQVIEHERYAAISDRNRIQLQPVAPRRGLIYDRNGILLADNQPTFSVTLLREEIRNIDETLEALAELIEITDRDVERFRQRLQQRRRPYESVPLRFRLTEEEIARISLNYHQLPGVQVEADLIRYYPYGESLAHVLGYVGRINERDLETLDPVKYAGTHYVGKLGVERFYEPILHGDVGSRKVETNARGRVLRILEQDDPTPGVDIQLSLDLRLQQFTEKLLEGRRASVVALDPKTGGILALVSTPAYDPNLFVMGISATDYNALRDDIDLPLFNRAVRGGYPPGSTIKPIIAMAAIDSETVRPDYTIWDPGYYQITPGGRRYRDWRRGGHGRVNLNLAIAQSVDTWFYDVGHRMGNEPMARYMRMFGFGEITALDTPEAIRGVLPTVDWKRGSLGEPWYPGDSVNMSIGQGYMVATPLQLAIAANVLANRGRWQQPRVLKGVLEETDEGRVLTLPDLVHSREVPEDVVIRHPEFWDPIIQGMVDVVHGPTGTARRVAQGMTYRMASKTGTAQVVAIPDDGRYNPDELSERHHDHALFIAFAPVEDPQIAIAVVVENGGGGSSVAAPIARQVMDAWLLNDYGTEEEPDDDGA